MPMFPTTCFCCSFVACFSLASFISTGASKKVDASTNVTFQTFQMDGTDVKTMAFSLDGTMAVTGHWNNEAKLWNVQKATLLRTLKGHDRIVLAVAFSPDGSTVLTGSSDSTAKLWDVESGEELHNLSHSGWVTCVAFAPGSDLAATGSNDGILRLFDVRSGELLRTWYDSGTSTPAAAMSIGFSADGARMLIGFNNGTTLLSGHIQEGQCDNTQTTASCSLKKKASSIALKGHNGWVIATDTSSDGRRLLTGGHDGTAVLWNASNGKKLHVLEGHNEGVSSVAFSPTSGSALTGGRDGIVRFWDVNGDMLLKLGGKQTKPRKKRRLNVKGVSPPRGSSIAAVAFSTDGFTALVGFMSPPKPKPKPVDPELAQCRERCGETEPEKMPIFDVR